LGGQEDYTELVAKALQVLKIKIPLNKRNLDYMLQMLKKISKGPVMSKSEICVHDRIRELVAAIEHKKAAKDITIVLEKLNDAVNYRDYWD